MEAKKNIFIGLKIAIGGLACQFVATVFVSILSRHSGSVLQQAVAFHLIYGIPMWLIVVLHLYQKKLVLLEQDEEEEIKKRSLDNSKIFEQVSYAYSAKQKLKQMEKWVIPVIAILVAFLNLYFFSEVFNLVQTPVFSINNPAMSAAFLFSTSFFLFMLGRFSAGLLSPSTLPLRVGSSVALSGALWCFIAGLSSAAFHLGFQLPEKVFSFIITLLFAVLGIEAIFYIILEFYRPRVGEEKYLIYESRILGLLVQPQGLTSAILDWLDYQFGFRISQVWFFRFLEKTVAPLVLFQIFTFFLLTSVFSVGPGQKAIVERFGKPRGEVFLPGLHFKLPFPIEKYYIHPVDMVQTLWLGFEGEMPQPEAYLWTRAHHEDEHLFIVATEKENAADAVTLNLISMNIQVQYRIRDIHSYMYKSANPVAILRNIAYREVVKESAGIDMLYALTVGRGEFAGGLKDSIQDALDRIGLGIEIVDISVVSLHPPVPIAGAFEAVIASMEEREALILDAQAYKEGLLPLSYARAAATLYSADAHFERTVLIASADGNRFLKQMLPEKKAPAYHRMKLYLDTLERTLPQVRKYVVPSGVEGRRITIIDLEERITPEALFMKEAR
jgi:HflK protein